MAPASLLILVFVALSSTPAGASWTGPGRSIAAAGQGAGQTFLGFRPGEEVRYALEREDEGRRRQDRIVHWGITLRDVDGSGSEGTFELSYIVVLAGERLAQAVAEARVNADGFPLDVRFTSERSTSVGTIGYNIEYRFDEERFRKELIGGDFDDQEIELDDYAGIDTRTPRGLYLYTPMDADCVRAFTAPPPAANAPTGGGRGEPSVEELCRGRELIFANPGLLNLTIPALWEAGTGSLEFFVLAPTGVRSELFTATPGTSGSGLNFGGVNLGALLGGGPDPFDDADRALQKLGLTAGSDLLQLDVGGRMVNAWRLDQPAPFPAVYVDGNGSIVRLDLPEDPRAERRGWIRRLRSSEF